MTHHKLILKADCPRKILVWSILLLVLLLGCTTVPKQLHITDLDQSFPVDAIIAAATGTSIEFDQLVDELRDVPMVFVGEVHNSAHHHSLQLRLIRALHQRRGRMSVGMEMFDRSYQSVLDVWVKGELEERQFIKQTQWYANWRFNFDLYREILTYLKDNGIPLVGLDLPTYIHSRIRAGGVENLLPADRNWLPDEIPPGDAEHRTFLERTFQQHQFLTRTTDFEDFYAAQCARDAAMARAIADHLPKGPMVILVGNGHIHGSSGVPQRARDYSGADYKTIYLAPVATEMALDSADYIWVTPEVRAHPRMR